MENYSFLFITNKMNLISKKNYVNLFTRVALRTSPGLFPSHAHSPVRGDTFSFPPNYLTGHPHPHHQTTTHCNPQQPTNPPCYLISSPLVAKEVTLTRRPIDQHQLGSFYFRSCPLLMGYFLY